MSEDPMRSPVSPFAKRQAENPNDVLRLISNIQHEDLAARFLWRGQADAAWGLQPSLFRRLLQLKDSNGIPTEAEMSAYETDLLNRAMGRDWYDNRSHASTYAVLQHHGAATRLLDVSRDPMVALWFAVENTALDQYDGSLFAINVSGATVISAVDRPSWTQFAELEPGRIGVYEPPWADERVKSQRAAFVWAVLSGRESRTWAYVQSGAEPLGTWIIIPSSAKPALRTYLEKNLEIHAESLFPDLDGFALAHSATKPFRYTGDELYKWG